VRFIASRDPGKLFLALFVVSLPLVAAGNTYGRLPLSFEPNQGQTDARVKFLARASEYTLFVTADEAVFTGRDGSVERMKLLGANPKLRFEPLNQQPGISNYFIGNDPSKWRTNIANYGKVALREVYPGIDLVFYGNERQLEYDWVVAPGADPKQIHVKWEGPSQVTKNASGDLVLSASLLQQKPVILQEGKRIEGGYVVHGREVVFELAKYDAAKPLVIDPVLVYSTYLGGRGADFGVGIAVDGSGNAYVTGDTISANSPPLALCRPATAAKMRS
jgi:Beta-propeller repeat